MPDTFNNDLLITSAGEINMDYVRSSARARAISISDTGAADPMEVTVWEGKLLAMAEMLQTRFWRNVTEDTRRRMAVAALIGQCEAIAKSGALTVPAEQSLRVLVARTLTAFDMPFKAERALEHA